MKSNPKNSCCRVDGKTIKKHTLQIDRPCFIEILNGRQKVEHRYVYPSNVNRYVVQEDTTDENGEPITIVTPVHYDALYLINGRRKDAPRMLVEVEDAEFVLCVDEEGKQKTLMQDGIEYYVCQVWYYLGKVLFTENLGNLAGCNINKHPITL